MRWASEWITKRCSSRVFVITHILQAWVTRLIFWKSSCSHPGTQPQDAKFDAGGRDGIGSLTAGIEHGCGRNRGFLPKFTDTSYNLSTYLKNLGMTDAFDRWLADLSGIAPVTPDRNLYVYTRRTSLGASGILFRHLADVYRAPVHIHNTGRRERGDPVHGKAVGSHGVAWGPALPCFAHRPDPVFAAPVACLSAVGTALLGSPNSRMKFLRLPATGTACHVRRRAVPAGPLFWSPSC